MITWENFYKRPSIYYWAAVCICVTVFIPYGIKGDVVIALQLAVYYSAPGDVRVIFSSLCGRIHIKDIQNRVGSENGPGLRSCDAGCRLCVQR